MLYTVTYKKLGGSKYTDYILEENLKNILSIIAEDEKLSLISIIPEDQKLQTPGFAHVCWDKDDLAEALENHGIDPTEENIEKLYNEVNTHWLSDAMIETGWDFIYESIFNINWED